MTQKRRIVVDGGLIVFAFLSLFTTQSYLIGANTTSCPVECRTYRDGSPVTRSGETSSNGGGGSSATDTIIVSDAAYGITKVLRQCDFNPSYTITCSGTYVFGEPIKYQGTSANSSALIIDADDVTVNLNGFALTYEICGATEDLENYLGDDGSTYISYGRNNNVNGILFCPPRKNITIRNGTIRLFTGYGIRAHGLTYEDDGTTVDEQGAIENVTINEVVANNNKVGMSFVAGDTTTTIKSATAAANYILSDIRVLYSTANFNDNTGILFNTVVNSEITGSTANSNGGTSNGGRGLTVAGIDLQNSRKLTLKENTAILNAIVSGSGDSYGIYLHRNGGSGAANQAAGTYLTVATSIGDALGENYAVVDSVLDSNKTEFNDWGFRDEMSPASTVYTRNQALNNGTTKDGQGNYYIFFANGNNVGVASHGQLANFTKIASLAQLNGLNAAGTYDNISIGIAGNAASTTDGATTTPDITPALLP